MVINIQNRAIRNAILNRLGGVVFGGVGMGVTPSLPP
jgi:hypothetical protein